jgi:hypothetical protein
VKAHPGTFYGHSSGSKQLSGEAFRLKAGLDMPPVAYKGAAPMMNDLLSGQIKIGFDEVLTSMQQIKAGKLYPIATTGSVRWPALPDVPTIAELGGPLADYEVTDGSGCWRPPEHRPGSSTASAIPCRRRSPTRTSASASTIRGPSRSAAARRRSRLSSPSSTSAGAS